MDIVLNRRIVCEKAFTLAETVIALVVGAMVLVTMWGVYGGVQRSAAAVTKKLDMLQLPYEVVQGIAEDLDRIVASQSDTQITVENKIIDGYPAARLTIKRTMDDGKGKQQEFETIIWQSSYDYDGDANGLTMYRSHTGITLEDKFLDERRADWEQAYSFVPVCSGVTHFSVHVPAGEELVEAWTGPQLPRGLVVTVSFAEPMETMEGTWEVPEEEKTVRAVAIGRTRTIAFTIVEPEFEDEEEEEKEKDEDEEEEAESGPTGPDEPNEPTRPRGR